MVVFGRSLAHAVVVAVSRVLLAGVDEEVLVEAREAGCLGAEIEPACSWSTKVLSSCEVDEGESCTPVVTLKGAGTSHGLDDFCSPAAGGQRSAGWVVGAICPVRAVVGEVHHVVGGVVGEVDVHARHVGGCRIAVEG